MVLGIAAQPTGYGLGAAYFRAKRQLLDRGQEGRPFSRPSTTVGELVKKIIENGKIGIRRKLI